MNTLRQAKIGDTVKVVKLHGALQRTAAFAVADTLTGPTAAATGPANGTNAGTARKRADAGRVHTGQP